MDGFFSDDWLGEGGCGGGVSGGLDHALLETLFYNEMMMLDDDKGEDILSSLNSQASSFGSSFVSPTGTTVESLYATASGGGERKDDEGGKSVDEKRPAGSCNTGGGAMAFHDYVFPPPSTISASPMPADAVSASSTTGSSGTAMKEKVSQHSQGPADQISWMTSAPLHSNAALAPDPPSLNHYEMGYTSQCQVASSGATHGTQTIPPSPYTEMGTGVSTPTTVPSSAVSSHPLAPAPPPGAFTPAPSHHSVGIFGGQSQHSLPVMQHCHHQTQIQTQQRLPSYQTQHLPSSHTQQHMPSHQTPSPAAGAPPIQSQTVPPPAAPAEPPGDTAPAAAPSAPHQQRATQLVHQFATLASRLGISLPPSVLTSLTAAAAMNEAKRASTDGGAAVNVESSQGLPVSEVHAVGQNTPSSTVAGVISVSSPAVVSGTQHHQGQENKPVATEATGSSSSLYQPPSMATTQTTSSSATVIPAAPVEKKEPSQQQQHYQKGEEKSNNHSKMNEMDCNEGNPSAPDPSPTTKNTTSVTTCPAIWQLHQTAEAAIAAVSESRKRALSTESGEDADAADSSTILSSSRGISGGGTNGTYSGGGGNNNSNGGGPQYKRRKKPRLEDCEARLAALKSENEMLRRHLDNVTNKTQKFDMERQKAERQMKEMVKNGATEEELNGVLTKFTEMYSDYGRHRHQELTFHLEQLEKLAVPTTFTKMGLWSLGQNDQFYYNPKRNPIAGILMKELGITPQQGRKIIENRQKIKNLCANIKQCLLLLGKLKALCQHKQKVFSDRMTKCQEILTPMQVVKLLIWIDGHSHLLEKVCPGWGSERIRTKAAASAAAGGAATTGNGHVGVGVGGSSTD